MTYSAHVRANLPAISRNRIGHETDMTSRSAMPNIGGYCRTKEALVRCCGGSTPELDALPERCVKHTTADNVQAAE